MAMSYDSGVRSYIVGIATVKSYFPVDARGNEDVTCVHCEFYRDSSRRCSLTGKVSDYPNRGPAATCPMSFYPAGLDRRPILDREPEDQAATEPPEEPADTPF